MSALLEIRNLSVRREGRTILDLNELEVQPGEILAIVGPNGAGKSTLFLALARLLPAEHAQIYFGGQSLDEMDALAYRRRIALILQEPLLLSVSVWENVAMGLRFRGIPTAEARRRVRPWLERLGIAHLEGRVAGKLSGGEAQRVSLARAFVLEPELLLLDEPFTALDAPTRAHLVEDLGAVLAETGTTSIFITHDLQEALKLATRLAVMLGGRIHQVGVPSQVYAQPADSQVAEFLGQPAAL